MSCQPCCVQVFERASGARISSNKNSGSSSGGRGLSAWRGQRITVSEKRPDGASRSAILPITNLSQSGRRIGAYIKIPLGIRNANALLLKQPPDLVEDLALHVMDAILGVLDPESQLELDRGLAKGHDQGVWGRHRQDALRIACRLAHQGERLVEVGIVRDADRHFKSDSI